MNLVRTDRTWVRSPLEVCVRILLHRTGRHEARLEKKNLSAGSDGGAVLWEKPGQRAIRHVARRIYPFKVHRGNNRHCPRFLTPVNHTFTPVNQAVCATVYRPVRLI